MVHLDESTHLYERILDLAPQAVEKIQQMFSNKNGSGQGQGQNSQSSQQNQQNQKNQYQNPEYGGPKQDLEL